MIRNRLLSLSLAVAVACGATAAGAQPRELGPPPGVDLEGTETEPTEESAPAALPTPRPTPGAGAAASGGAGTDPKTAAAGEQAEETARTARGGVVAEGEILLDIPLDQIPNYRGMMRDIVEELARYARGRDPKFGIVARPGFDLITWSAREYDLEEIRRDPTAVVSAETVRQVGTPMRRYIQSIDGFVLNGQFCSPLRIPRADLASARAEGLKALSIETCPSEAAAVSALQNAARSGFVTFAGSADDKTFSRLPNWRPLPENPGNVEVLDDARNMLLLLSAKSFGSRADWLNALAANNYDLVIIDAFDRKDQPLTKDEVYKLKFKQMGARRLVFARMDIGHADESRFYWQRDWDVGKPTWITGRDRDTPGSYYVEFWNPAWKAIVGRYFAGILDLGFDGVMLDGVEAYRRWEAKTPVNLTR